MEPSRHKALRMNTLRDDSKSTGEGTANGIQRGCLKMNRSILRQPLHYTLDLEIAAKSGSHRGRYRQTGNEYSP